jgi:hypothetical protein
MTYRGARSANRIRPAPTLTRPSIGQQWAASHYQRGRRHRPVKSAQFRKPLQIRGIRARRGWLEWSLFRGLRLRPFAIRLQSASTPPSAVSIAAATSPVAAVRIGGSACPGPRPRDQPGTAGARRCIVGPRRGALAPLRTSGRATDTTWSRSGIFAPRAVRPGAHQAMVYSASTPLKLVATSAENGYCMLLEHGRGSRDEREAPAPTIAYTPTRRKGSARPRRPAPSRWPTSSIPLPGSDLRSRDRQPGRSNLVASLDRNPRELRIIYLLPVCADYILETGLARGRVARCEARSHRPPGGSA